MPQRSSDQFSLNLRDFGKAMNRALKSIGPGPRAAALAACFPLCILVAFGMLVGPAASAPPARIRNAVVLVVKRDPEEGKYVPIGTAFHIGGGWFRTAAHVVRSKLPKRYEGKGYNEWALHRSDEFGNPGRYLGAFEITCVDRRWIHDADGAVFPHDSALVRLNGSSVPDEALPAAGARPRLGEAVSVWGFPMGSVLFESRAKIAGISDRWIDVQEDVGSPVLGGHSGSPVINRTGDVIGIMSAGVEGVGQRGSAVPIWDAELGCPKP